MKTELEAVNDILNSNREEGVDFLEPDNDDKVFIALTKLNQARKHYLSKNLVINTDLSYKLYPNDDKLIELPKFLKVKFYDERYKTARSRDDNKFYVYDRYNNTFEINNEVECLLVRDLEFEDIADYEIQELITLKASIEYYKTDNEFDNTVQSMTQDLITKEYQLMIELSYDMDANLFDSDYFKEKKWFR